MDRGTLQGELYVVSLFDYASERRCDVLTFPGFPPSILITRELSRSISGRDTRLDAMFVI